MAEVPNNKKKNFIPNPPNANKPNYQIWVVIVLSAVIFGIFFFNKNNTVKEISLKRFEQNHARQ